jgi:3-oxoacyl-[acyl-carrier protein] reductase
LDIEEIPFMVEEQKTHPQLPKGLSLLGRRALVTGAANGIGRATAKCLAELGADLVLVDRVPMDALCKEIEALGRSASMLQGDLTDQAFLDRIIDGGPYYSFAHVAGVFSGSTGGYSGSSVKGSFDFVMDVNVWAPLALGYGLIEKAGPKAGGYMVFTGSQAGRSGKGRIGTGTEYITYAASKGALHSLVRALASRGAEKNIVVNGVAPGVIRTPMLDLTAPHLKNSETVTPLGRSADPSEVGWPIALLCSPAASFISGAIVDVNGGSYVG